MEQYGNQLGAPREANVANGQTGVRLLSADEIELIGGGTTGIDEYPLPRR